MAKKADAAKASDVEPKPNKTDELRPAAEVLFAEELEALIANDKDEKPPGWKMSPRAVHTYICGARRESSTSRLNTSAIHAWLRLRSPRW